MTAISAHKVLFVIAPEKFRDEEYFEPKKVLEDAGIATTTASTVTGEVTGKLGGKAVSAVTLDRVNPADYRAILFIGGAGSRRYYDDPVAHRIAQYAADPSHGMMVGAICSAAGILARAGILRNKKATVFSGDSCELTSGGATYTGADLEQDGNIVTASGPHAATAFGMRIVQLLNSRETVDGKR